MAYRILVVGFVFVCLLSAAHGHYPPGVGYKVFQFSEQNLPKIDGDPGDWEAVPKSYTIDGSHLADTVMGKGTKMDPDDLAVEVTVGWCPSTNRLYFLYRMHDDMHNFNMARGDIFEIVLDADHSGGRYHSFADVAPDIEARLKSTACQNYHIYTPPAAGKAWAWVWGPQQGLVGKPWSEHAYSYDFEMKEPGLAVRLDLEYGVLGGAAVPAENALEAIDRAHERVGQAFEDCITAKTRGIFGVHTGRG